MALCCVALTVCGGSDRVAVRSDRLRMLPGVLLLVVCGCWCGVSLIVGGLLVRMLVLVSDRLCGSVLALWCAVVDGMACGYSVRCVACWACSAVVSG